MFGGVKTCREFLAEYAKVATQTASSRSAGFWVLGIQQSPRQTRSTSMAILVHALYWVCPRGRYTHISPNLCGVCRHPPQHLFFICYKKIQRIQRNPKRLFIHPLYTDVCSQKWQMIPFWHCFTGIFLVKQKKYRNDRRHRHVRSVPDIGIKCLIHRLVQSPHVGGARLAQGVKATVNATLSGIWRTGAKRLSPQGWLWRPLRELERRPSHDPAAASPCKGESSHNRWPNQEWVRSEWSQVAEDAEWRTRSKSLTTVAQSQTSPAWLKI